MYPFFPSWAPATLPYPPRTARAAPANAGHLKTPMRAISCRPPPRLCRCHQVRHPVGHGNCPTRSHKAKQPHVQAAGPLRRRADGNAPTAYPPIHLRLQEAPQPMHRRASRNVGLRSRGARRTRPSPTCNSSACEVGEVRTAETPARRHAFRNGHLHNATLRCVDQHALRKDRLSASTNSSNSRNPEALPLNPKECGAEIDRHFLHARPSGPSLGKFS